MLPCSMIRPETWFLRTPPPRNSFQTSALRTPVFCISATPTQQTHLFTLKKTTGVYPQTAPKKLTPPTAADSINLHPSQTLFPEIRPCASRSSTMNLAYFDCFSGISGDMTLGALLDAGCDLARLRADLQSLQVPGWESPPKKSGKAAWPPPTPRSRRKTRRSTAA